MPLDLQGELNRLAKTNGVGSALAAKIWTACPQPYDVAGCLNFKAFGDGPENRQKWLDVQGAANVLAGTQGLGAPLALSKIATPP